MSALLKWIGGAALFVVAVAAGLWFSYLRPTSIHQTLENEASSLSLTSWILQAGPTPQDWETRAYLPTASVQKLADALVGLEFVSRQGNRDEAGHYDGAFVVKLESLSISTGAAELRPKVAVSVRYEPDRAKPWWGAANFALKLDAVFMPVVRNDPDTGRPVVKLLVVPTSVSPALSWNPITLFSAGQATSELIATGVFVKFGEALSLVAPTIREPLKIEAKADSKSYSKFDKGGGYNLRTQMNGPTFERALQADIPLVTSRGIWLLGQTGRQLPEPSASPGAATDLRKTVDDLRRTVNAKLGPFERSDDLAEVRISNRQIMEIAEEIKKPENATRFAIGIGSSDATGTIGDAFLLKDDLLGNIGLTVRPRVPDFLTGSVQIQPPQFEWVAGTGLKTTISASAKVTASTNIHLSTAFVGGGIGKDIDLIGETSVSMPVSLAVERRETDAGTAVVLQPQLACAPIQVDVNPATREDIIKEAWIALKPFGVRVKRNVGGGQQAPSIVLSSLPTVYSLGNKEDDDAANPAAKRDYVRVRQVVVRWSIDQVEVQQDGLLVRAGVAVVSAAAQPANDQETDVARLKNALLAAAPNVPCEPSDAYALLLLQNQVEIGSNNEVVVFIKRVFKEGGHVADETKKEVEKLTKTPFKSVTDFPDNAIRESGKAFENLGKAAGDAGQAVGNAVKNTVCGEKCAFGHCVRIC
ncbi:hypothetical protein EOA23_27770 [Mesorhizobium sp. M2A.F.Ca.ET.042.01.1.1]|uniref:hypothetical protein n=1 Tax=Mesorhizobium sp. M2A.F.Ca.ET.042.01.1.1 TaxID=2496745 RepID=UPI000FCAA9C6|nr:hypothetical protein [Mesorhizobium sp. M2A.F.Ca.ET.042.01.1.1]RUX20704.1 hypothetical protein EOA23_27770 [Mesorhizobium sp. M2A.F.Ca.ET.042.01.1.1]